MHRWVSVFAVLLAAPVLASSHTVTTDSMTVRSQGWSVETGKTLPAGTDVIYGTFGFPGLSGTYLHGVQPNFDIGGRFTFNYGVESDTSNIHPELKFQFVMRFGVIHNPKFNLALEIAPGPLLWFSGGTNFGIAIPIEAKAGIPIASNLNICLGLDVPMWINFTGETFAGIPILFGGGIEYFIQSDLALTFRLRMGPEIYTLSGSPSDFALQSLVGVALRL